MSQKQSLWAILNGCGDSQYQGGFEDEGASSMELTQRGGAAAGDLATAKTSRRGRVGAAGGSEPEAERGQPPVVVGLDWSHIHLLHVVGFFPLFFNVNLRRPNRSSTCWNSTIAMCACILTGQSEEKIRIPATHLLGLGDLQQ